jgi:predicted ATP-dependent Lon-type protease
VSNASGKIGLVGYWDCICFDEFAGKDKRVDKTLVDIMKNYMANRTFSRGIEQLSAEASMVFMGNTQKSVATMLKHSHFYEPLPDNYIDSAFIDRIHAFKPGWEVQPVRHELYCTGYGFVVDYIAEVLKHLRTEDFTGLYKPFFEISSEVSARDQTGLEKTFSGLMKIIHPDGKASKQEMAELLKFALECRRLFGDYLRGATGIIIRDPYIRAFHQLRNLVEFLRMVNEITPTGDEVTIHLITGSDQESMEKQVDNLGQVQDSFADTSTPFSWEIDASPNVHARSITTNHGWMITLDRGLNLFQGFEFSVLKAEAAVQEARLVKGCEINSIAIKS